MRNRMKNENQNDNCAANGVSVVSNAQTPDV